MTGPTRRSSHPPLVNSIPHPRDRRHVSAVVQVAAILQTGVLGGGDTTRAMSNSFTDPDETGTHTLVESAHVVDPRETRLDPTCVSTTAHQSRVPTFPVPLRGVHTGTDPRRTTTPRRRCRPVTPCTRRVLVHPGVSVVSSVGKRLGDPLSPLNPPRGPRRHGTVCGVCVGARTRPVYCGPGGVTEVLPGVSDGRVGSTP